MLTLYTPFPAVVASEAAGAWHLHATPEAPGWWSIAHASGVHVWGPTNDEARARAILAALQAAPPAPYGLVDIRQMVFRPEVRDETFTAWVGEIKTILEGAR